VQLGAIGQLKNPKISSGIEPANFKQSVSNFASVANTILLVLKSYSQKGTFIVSVPSSVSIGSFHTGRVYMVSFFTFAFIPFTFYAPFFGQHCLQV
jgi:hypothetical protein